MSNLRQEIEQAINRCNAESGSETPDWILAEYLMGCLEAFDKAVKARSNWYGSPPHKGSEERSNITPN